MINLFENDQPITSRIIKNSVNKNHYAHAYIIETNGYEKGFDLALNFAKIILCPHYNNGQPLCENCNQCKMIDSQNYPELKIINPDGSWIKKEQLIELQEEFNKKSIIGNKKVYIINKADKLNASSSNTILKFLEEPEEGIIAILVTNNRYQLLETISSRCQIISLNGQVQKGNNLIEKLGLLLNDNETDYEKFINDENNNDQIDSIIKFVNCIEKYGLKSILYMYDYFLQYFNTKENISWAIIIMIYFYKDILNYKINANIELFDEYKEDIKNISNKNDINELLNKINILNENRKNIDNNANLNLLMDRIIIEIEGVI
jgi:DNA polymerase-3 subunit delta'